MKISELIKTLEERKEKHGDVEVCPTWEGQIWSSFKEKDIYLGLHYYKTKNKILLLINCETNKRDIYKKEFAIDPHEG